MLRPNIKVHVIENTYEALLNKLFEVEKEMKSKNMEINNIITNPPYNQFVDTKCIKEMTKVCPKITALIPYNRTHSDKNNFLPYIKNHIVEIKNIGKNVFNNVMVDDIMILKLDMNKNEDWGLYDGQERAFFNEYNTIPPEFVDIKLSKYKLQDLNKCLIYNEGEKKFRDEHICITDWVERMGKVYVYTSNFTHPLCNGNYKEDWYSIFDFVTKDISTRSSDGKKLTRAVAWEFDTTEERDRFYDMLFDLNWKKYCRTICGDYKFWDPEKAVARNKPNKPNLLFGVLNSDYEEVEVED
jgi:hypothetical protein